MVYINVSLLGVRKAMKPSGSDLNFGTNLTLVRIIYVNVILVC